MGVTVTFGLLRPILRSGVSTYLRSGLVIQLPPGTLSTVVSVLSAPNLMISRGVEHLCMSFCVTDLLNPLETLPSGFLRNTGVADEAKILFQNGVVGSTYVTVPSPFDTAFSVFAQAGAGQNSTAQATASPAIIDEFLIIVSDVGIRTVRVAESSVFGFGQASP